MVKQTFFISAPVDSHSGYGAKARDIVLSIIKSGKYNVRVYSQRWGNTPQGYLDVTNSDHKLILDVLIVSNDIDQIPDIWAQITVPNEMQRVGKFNILFTSGIETDRASEEFIKGCNVADLVIVPSTFTKTTLQQSIYPNTRLLKPVEVVFEGLNTEVFFHKETDDFDLDMISENFCFLFESHWLNGEFGEDRKDVGGLIKTFLETFKDKKIKPALILKTSGGSYSVMDKSEIVNRITAIKKLVKGDLPNIYLIHGELSEEQINSLNNHSKVKAFVSFTKGEGWGRCLLEASVTKKPVIVSNWSGHLDFLKYHIPLSGSVKLVHKSVVNKMIINGSRWFTVDYNAAKRVLENMFTNYKNNLELAKRQAYLSRTEFSLSKMDERLHQILNNIKQR